MKTLFRLAGILLFAWVLAGCESTKAKPTDDSNLSQLPQNRPQSWEGSAALGSFFPNAN